MARLELEVGTDVLLLETGDALLLEGAMAWEKILSDSMAIADSPVKVAEFSRSLSDSVALADGISKVAAFARSLSDTVTITDSIADILEWLTLC